MSNGLDPTLDPVVGALGRLRVAAPASLSDAVFDSWMRAPGPLGEVYVAFTRDGVSFLRTAESLPGDGEEFREAYRTRYQRPLRPATRAPRGLLPALRGTKSAGPALDLRGLSDFERDVLSATRRIPAGETRPYAWVAREAGRPNAFRAVGSVLAGNPVPLLIPCHRVVRTDGTLGQYLFGPSSKAALLRGEHADLDEIDTLAKAGVHYLGSDTTGVVCFPTCRNARRITPAHRHGFRTLTGALGAGYRPCRHCRPAVEGEPA
ncbi:MAG: methylated-DNA--[protein]-cysteine S-methyltransferase [Pseudonocardiaceae bacterium]|nr:methylated-DNA--[protein]-cysteine S-methyltransferase [Pseudonocardiaceae bacterium]